LNKKRTNDPEKIAEMERLKVILEWKGRCDGTRAKGGHKEIPGDLALLGGVQQQERQPCSAVRDEIIKEVISFFLLSDSRVEIEESYSVFSGEPIMETQASNKGITEQGLQDLIRDTDRKHTLVTVNDFLKCHNPDIITKVRYEFWPSQVALPAGYVPQVRRKAAWEGSIYSAMRRLLISSSDALQYHSLGILFPVGLFDAVIEAYFEPICEGIYRIKPEIQTLIDTSGSIENVATGGKYQIGPSGLVSFKGFFGRFGLRYLTLGNAGGSRYEGTFKLVDVAGLSKASLVIYDVTPALFQQYKIDAFCKENRVSMEYMAGILAYGGRISKDFFIGKGAVNLKDLSGAEAEVSFFLKTVEELKNEKWTMDKAKGTDVFAGMPSSCNNKRNCNC
jgi:hypothetical protein